MAAYRDVHLLLRPLCPPAQTDEEFEPDPVFPTPIPRDSSSLSSADGYTIACTTAPKEEAKGTAEDGHGRKQKWKEAENKP